MSRMAVDKPMYHTFRKTLYHPPKKQTDPHSSSRTATSAIGQGPLDHSRGRLYISDGYVLYSPNCSRVVPVPPPMDSNSTLWMDPALDDSEDLHQPRWWSEETAYLAFVCLQPKYVGIPLETHLTIPQKAVRFDRRGYCAESWRKLGWYRLETIMHLMMDALQSKYSLPPCRRIVDRALILKTFFKKPQDYKNAARRTVSWFSAVVAQMSWSLAVAATLDNELDLDNKTQRPTWLEFLSKYSAHWDEIYLASLRKTLGIFGRHTPRVGVFLNILHPPEFQYSVDWLMKVHVPVYYPWGAPEATAAMKNDSLQRLSPTLELLQELYTVILRRVSCKEESYSQIATECLMDGESHNACSRSHQRGETERFSWSTFSQRRQEAVIVLMKQESADQTTSRLQRERSPPIVNTKVFVWEVDENGSYTRIAVRKYENHDTLASFKASQKVYHSFFNEWDCSYDFQINEEADVEVPDDDPTGEFKDSEDYAVLPDHPDTDTNIPGPNISATFALDQDDTDFATTNMVTLFREYYGFVPSLCVQNEPQTVDLEPKYITRLQGFVGLSSEQRDNLTPNSVLLQLHTFAICVLEHKSGPRRLTEPVDFWDLVFGNRQYLGCSSRLHRLRRVHGLDDNLTYFLFDFGESRTVEWNLVVPSIVTALFICRLNTQWNETTICTELLRRGLQFHTLFPSPRFATTLPPPPVYTDVLPANYQFTQRDYENYVYCRSNLLESCRVIRAALMRGGLVWRLSLSHTSLSEETALLSSTNYATKQGISISFQGGVWKDDCHITPEELDAICGTYECLTGIGLNQTVTKSWWPPYSVWCKHYDYDYWTHKMEDRFQARLRDLDAGRAYPLTRQQWRDWVRGGSNVRGAKFGITNASMQLLNTT